jgi:integrase
MNRVTMIDTVERYIAYRRDLGCQLDAARSYLRQFGRYADRVRHRGPLTTALLARWARLPADRGPPCWSRRLSAVRGLARYLAASEPGTQIPPARMFGATRRPTPHIYTDAEVAALVAAARHSSRTDRVRSRSYAALIGLLASSGLRVSEALQLKRSDFDARRGVLTVRETKFAKSRLVPLHPSTTEALLAYARARDRHVPRDTTDSFFVTGRGRPLYYETMRRVFRRLCDGLGIAGRGSRRRPRIHDLRHTFACRRVRQWYEDGIDVHRAVGALATYLGHVNVSCTYWYLTATPELLGRAAARFESCVLAREEDRP